MPASRGAPRTDPTTSRLAGWIEPVVASAGYDLEELVVTPAGRRSVVRVVVDRDEGVTLDDVALVSRSVSEALDAHDDGMGRTPYVLEVTSPGVDRPLTEPRHWRRNVGRLVTAVLTDGTSETGRLTAAEEGSVELGGRRLALADVVRGTVQVEFSRPGDAAGPDAADGDGDGDEGPADDGDDSDDGTEERA